MKNDITLLIGTCDRYSFLWDNFVTLCDKYWNVDCQKIFAGETKQVQKKGYYTSMCGRRSWSDIIKITLDYIKTEYVFFILEDCFLHTHITENFIERGISFLKENGANKLVYTSAYCEYYNISHYDKNIFKMLDNSDYLTTMQPAIWKTDFLKKCLLSNMNPWQFETDGTNLIKNNDNRIYIYHTDEIYFNVVNKGSIVNRWDLFKKIENLPDFDF